MPARSLVYSRFQTNDRGLRSGNETSCAHAYKIRKWRPSQRTAASECCEWLLLTRVNFEAMKTLSGWEAERCDEHPFRAKIKVSTWAVFELSSFDKWSEQRKKKEYEKWYFCYRTLLRLAVFHVAFGHLYESCWSQRHSKRMSGLLNKLLACCGEVIRLLLKYCIYCASAPSLHRESTDSLIS